MRVEHEYVSKGAWAYLAAWDVHQARVARRRRGGPRAPSFKHISVARAGDVARLDIIVGTRE